MKLGSFLWLMFVLTVHAQYEINWFTFDGGGGTSTGSVYSVSGTIGQPDAGNSTGGNYMLLGGFWSYAGVIRSEDAPLLRIVRDGPNVILAWPNPSTGFRLQKTAALSSPNWSDVNGTPNVVGSEKQLPLSIQPGSQFFRLRKF